MRLAVLLVSCQFTDEQTEAQENEELAQGHRAKDEGARCLKASRIVAFLSWGVEGSDCDVGRTVWAAESGPFFTLWMPQPL